MENDEVIPLLFERTMDLEQYLSINKNIRPVFMTGSREKSKSIEDNIEARCVIELRHRELCPSWSSTSADIEDELQIYVDGTCIEGMDSIDELDEYFKEIIPENADVFIDISSTGVRLLSIILSNLVLTVRKYNSIRRVYCGYAEPNSYTRRGIVSENGTCKQAQFALYNNFAPLGPLPNFESIGSDEKPQLWVVLLGFEGYRTDTIDDELSRVDDIIALVTIPSLKLGWSNHAISENAHFLRGVDHKMPSIRYATASSPFAVYNFLSKLQEKYNDYRLQISPFSTKANSLGALLYALSNPHASIVFDNPIEASRPSSIYSNIYHVYDITEALAIICE